VNRELLEQAKQALAKRWPGAHPVRGLICGSGWSAVVAEFSARGAIDFAEIPGLGAPGVAGHTGQAIWADLAGQETLIFQGRRHWYEGEGWTPVAIPVFLMKQMGVRTAVLTNAAGGIRKDLKPGDLMVIDDHINLLGNPLIGPHDPAWGSRFTDQSQAYDPGLRKMADRAGKAAGVKPAHGTYLATSGPTYETPAEIRAFRTLGADAVGMSTVPETLLANSAGMRVLGLSCITNFAAGISSTPLSHEEVTSTTQAAMPRMKALLVELWKEFSHEH
jgi:purine-nucleoside phosphorylase